MRKAKVLGPSSAPASPTRSPAPSRLPHRAQQRRVVPSGVTAFYSFAPQARCPSIAASRPLGLLLRSELIETRSASYAKRLLASCGPIQATHCRHLSEAEGLGRVWRGSGGRAVAPTPKARQRAVSAASRTGMMEVFGRACSV